MTEPIFCRCLTLADLYWLILFVVAVITCGCIVLIRVYASVCLDDDDSPGP